jgi:hypothetical protein
MFHKDPNESTYIPEYEDIKYKNITLSYENLQKGLLKQMKKYTIHEPTMFIIPENYRITEDDLHYIEKYTIGIKRNKNEDKDV